MTRSNLIAYIEKNNLRHEIHVTEKTDRWTTELIGFEKKGKGLLWHWFEVMTRIADENHPGGQYVTFDHSYSQRTGRIKKGTMHSVKLSISIKDNLAK